MPADRAIRADHLLAFCHAARRGSVTRAAEALGLSQPAVSRQIGALERAVGHELLRRGGGGVEPTEAGLELLPYACAVAATLEEARRHLAGGAAEGPLELRVGLSHHLVTRLTGPLLRRARELGDGLRLHLVEGYSAPLRDDVRARRLDAAVVLGDRVLGDRVPDDGAPAEPVPADVLSARREALLGRDALCLLVLPDDPLARQARAPWEVLHGETVVLPSADSRIYRAARARLERRGVAPGRLVEVSGPAAVRSAVQAGQGIGVTLASFVAPETRAGWLRSVLPEPPLRLPIRRVGHPPETLTSARRGVLDALLAPFGPDAAETAAPAPEPRP